MLLSVKGGVEVDAGLFLVGAVLLGLAVPLQATVACPDVGGAAGREGNDYLPGFVGPGLGLWAGGKGQRGQGAQQRVGEVLHRCLLQVL